MDGDGNSPSAVIDSDVSLNEHLGVLRNGTDLNHHQETPLQNGIPKSVPQTPTRRRLDQRITSRVSKVLERPIASTTSSISDHNGNNAIASSTEGLVKVLKLKKLSSLIHSSDFEYPYGTACVLAVGEIVVCGTTKGYILSYDLFNKTHQMFHCRESTESGSITSLAISADSTYFASGFENGTIILWDADKNNNPVLVIPGLTQSDLAKGTKEGHLVGSKIHHIHFVGKRHTALMSTDTNGLLCYHNGYRNVLGYHVISRKILGRYSYENSSSHLLSTALLPLGTWPGPTDSIGLTAIMTPHALIVISIYPKLQTHFKIGKLKAVSRHLPITACVSWLPALKSQTSDSGEGQGTNPKICYCWSNVLTVFDVGHDVMKDHDTDEQIVSVKFGNKKRWVGEESLVAIQWVNDKMLAVLTSGLRLILINESSMEVVSTVDLLGIGIQSLKLFKDPLFNLVYSNSLKTVKGKLFFLGEKDVFVATLTNWADNLMEFIGAEDYIGALKQCRTFYLGDLDDVIIYGLPASSSKRKELLFNNTAELISATLENIFKDMERSYELDPDIFARFLDLVFQIYVDFDGKFEPGFLDDVFEKFTNFNLEDLFFAKLKDYILKEKIIHLTPTILKLLVEEFASKEKGEELEELICLLDISTLDINLAVSLCEQYHLCDTLVYIWNVLLDDYVTPFFDFVKLIVKLNHADLSDSERQVLKDELSRVYGYLSYILTGRQYPTERMIDFEKMRIAKQKLYYVVFSGASLTWPKTGGSKIHISDNIQLEPAFPYLYLLLKFNFFETLGALNEAFEDDLLNDDSSDYYDLNSEFELKVTRQYIIDVLFDVYRSNKSVFSEVENTYLAIFVARNYPKFKQFINLSDSQCEELIETLCSYPENDLKEDCELSLQSLLSVYHPINVKDLIYFFERAGFYDVLFSVYRSEQKFHKVLEIWLSNKERAQLEMELLHRSSGDYEKDSDIVRKCYELTKSNHRERQEINIFIKENFQALVAEDTTSMIKLFTKYDPDLHGEILNSRYDDAFAYDYLKNLFSLSNTLGVTPDLQTKLTHRYIELLAEFDQTQLYDFLKKKNLADDSSSKELIPILKKYRATDSTVLIYESLKQYKLCIDEIAGQLDFYKEKIIRILEGDEDFSSFKDIEHDLWKYLFIGIKICDYDIDEAPNGDILTPNEWLWLRIAQSTVDILKAVNSTLMDKEKTGDQSYILDTVKRLTQDCFTNLINSRSVEEPSRFSPEDDGAESLQTVAPKKMTFFNVFNEFLNLSSSSSDKLTTLSDVRLILREIFLSYQYDTTIQKTMLRLFNDRVFSELENTNSLKLQGLTSNKAECDACGKALWGPHIGTSVYELWKSAELAKLKSEDGHFLTSSGIHINSSLSELAITLFHCGHSFHEHCLFGLSGESLRDCLICDQ